MNLSLPSTIYISCVIFFCLRWRSLFVLAAHDDFIELVLFPFSARERASLILVTDF